MLRSGQVRTERTHTSRKAGNWKEETFWSHKKHAIHRLLAACLRWRLAGRSLPRRQTASRP